MKKMIFGMAFVAATIFATATANAAPMRAADDTKTEQCCKEKKHCDRKDKDCKERKGHGHHAGKKEHGHKPDMFAGITLTAEQQTKIDALRSDMKARKKAAKEATKAAERARTEEGKAKMQAERKAAMEKFDSEVKQILTPEQYKIFEQNREAAKAKMKSRMEKMQTAKLMKKKPMRDGENQVKLPVNPKAIYPKTANS
ncbi:MAG: Spy/CpxP family protein refolding chaperone [Muribaculaceae bacterium]|nr:Spy/CpxP family protein refolding chaperone [Muribaculaceae bacterium]